MMTLLKIQMMTFKTKYFGIIIPLTTAPLLIPTSMMNSKTNLSHSEIARLAKRDQLRNEGGTTTCNFYASPLKFKPDWAKA